MNNVRNLAQDINSVLDFSFLNTLHQFDSIYPHITRNVLTPTPPDPLRNILSNMNMNMNMNMNVENALINGNTNMERATDERLYESMIQMSFHNDQVETEKSILSKKGEKQLKHIIFDIKNKNKYKNTICPITQTKFKDNDNIIQLPCSHLFEPASIMQWLKNEKAVCPVCRFNLDSVLIISNPSSNTSSINNNEGIAPNVTLYDELNIGNYYNSYVQQILHRYDST
jgi:hypothetical protein